jgi:transposase
MIEAAPQREHSLRELFNALRYVIRYGIAWRAMPNDFPPWAAVYQHVNQHATGTPLHNPANSLMKNENLCSGWGPDRRRSGPHLKGRLHLCLNDLAGC